MIFRSYLPAKPLSQYVSMLWYVAGEMPHRREKILPTGTVELIINLAAPYRVWPGSKPQFASDSRHFWVAGFQSSYLVNQASDIRVNTIGASFRPGGAYAIFGFPLSELRDQVVELDLVWGAEAGRIRDRVLSAGRVAAMFEAFERALLERLEREPYGFGLVTYAADLITAAGKIPSIASLSQHIGVSQKHLIHQFNKLVGVNPKTLARIRRFQHALAAAGQGEDVHWTRLAHACGYYDQAHFNKDFQAFSGLTPSEYLQLRQNIALDGGDNNGFVPVKAEAAGLP